MALDGCDSHHMSESLGPTKPDTRPTVFVVCCSFLIVACLGLAQIDIGIWLEDEGLYWYGVWRTSLGEVPILDFQSYDPGRYYWSGCLAALFGDGILNIRLYSALFLVICLAMGMLAATRFVSSRWKLVLVGIVLVSWMNSRSRVFDSGIPLAAVYVAVLLMENPSFARHFLAGVFVGLAAFFGQNHGLYTFLGFLCIIVFIAIRCDKGPLIRRLGIWTGGVIVGYSPLLLMLVLVPGFHESFVAQVIYNVSSPNTGRPPLPVPWPWHLKESLAFGFTSLVHHLFVGIYFMLLPVFFLSGIAASLFAKPEVVRRSIVLIASCFIGIFYLHHIFARADAGHLADAMGPFLLGVMALPFSFGFKQVRLLTLPVVLFCASAVYASLEEHPGYDYFVGKRYHYVDYKIADQRMRIEKATAMFVEVVKRITKKYVAADEELLIAPHWPGLYYILKRKSPTKETFILGPGDVNSQQKLIADIERHPVKWMILGNLPLDNQDDLRFSNTHPLVWTYFKKNYRTVPIRLLPDDFWFLRRVKPLNGGK